MGFIGKFKKREAKSPILLGGPKSPGQKTNLESDTMSAMTGMPTGNASTKNTLNAMNATAPIRYHFGSDEYKEASILRKDKFTVVG